MAIARLKFFRKIFRVCERKFCPVLRETKHHYYGNRSAPHLILFIHGFCGNARKTWINDKTRFNFAKELQKNIPACYVASFSYVTTLNSSPSILSITDHLTQFLKDLTNRSSYQRISIVAHSMGGIIAREYILRRHKHRFPSIPITHLITLGTPTNGSELTTLGELISDNRQIREMRHIDVDEGNPYIMSLNSDWNREFKAMGHPRYILWCAGYEELPLRYLGKIVRLSSAIPYSDDPMPFHKDHLTIAKPSNAQDPVYTWVRTSLNTDLRQLADRTVDALVQQGLITRWDTPNYRQRFLDILEQWRTRSDTALDDTLSLAKTGQLQPALEELSKIEQSLEWSHDTYRGKVIGLKAQLLELQGKATEAESLYEQAINLLPSEPTFSLSYARLMASTGKSEKAVTLYKMTEDLYVKIGSRREAAFMILEAGAVEDMAGRSDEALSLFVKAQKRFEELGDVDGRMRARANIGAAYVTKSHYKDALPFVDEAESYFRSGGHLRDLSTALLNKGTAVVFLGKYPEARACYSEALEIATQLNEYANQAIALNGLGDIALNKGELEEASRYFSKAAELGRNTGNLEVTATALNSLGNLNRARASDAVENLPRKTVYLGHAINRFQEALEVSKTLAKRGPILSNLGAAYQENGNYREAHAHYERALEIESREKDWRGFADTLMNLANLVSQDLRDPEKARPLYQKAIDTYRDIDYQKGEALACENLGYMLAELDDLSNGFSYLDKAKKIYERLDLPFRNQGLYDRLRDELGE